MLSENFWKKYFKAYDVLNSSIPYQELLNDIIVAAEIKRSDMILDAGSGTGNLAIKLEKKCAKVIGFDFSKAGIKIHHRKNPAAEVIEGDLTIKLPFRNNFFDKIVSNNVIYTIDKTKREFIFREFYRILKPGGKIVIANIHRGFKPWAIFIDHLKKTNKNFGLYRAVKDLLVYNFLIIKIFYYNWLIKKENKHGDYDFLMKNEQADLLQSANLKLSNETKITYSGQSYLNKAIK